MLKCQNNACQNREYYEAENTDESCIHHPGGPIFHDALKGWSCCKKRVIDFNDFLNIPGCTTGRHNDMKQADRLAAAVKEKQSQAAENAPSSSSTTSQHKIPEMAERDHRQYGKETIVTGAPLQHELEQFNLERPDVNANINELQYKTMASLASAVKRAREKIEKTKEQLKLGDQAEIQPGTKCFRGGCGAEYPNYHTCKHHPGHPVFHEGMKYWSCCERKTSDFNNFLNQPGCTTRSEHKWTGLGSRNILNVKHDWHQQGDHVCITLYAKNSLIETFTIRANEIFIDMEVEYEAGIAKLEFAVELFGMVDLQHKSTKITVAGSKIEIQLRKKQLMRWTDLEYTGTEIQKVTTSLEEESEPAVDSTAGVEKAMEQVDVDSSDIDDYCTKAEPKDTGIFDSSDIDDYL